MGGLTTFDRLFDEAAPLIRHGRHERDSPPIEPGGRWPVTVVIRPDQAAAARLEQVMVQVEVIGLDLVGLTLTPSSVMVCAVPVGKSADRFMDLLRDELGDDAWREAGFDGDIWYATVLHFAADIAHPAEMVEWVEQRRGLDLGHTTTDVAELVRFRYEDGPDGRVMRPEVLAAARIGGGSAAVPQPTTRSVDS